MSISTYDRYAPYARAGLRGARSLYNLYANSTRIAGPPSLQSQVNLLRRTVARNTPQTANWNDVGGNISTGGVAGFSGFTYSLTQRFIDSGSDYTSSVLGDYFRNQRVMFKLAANQGIENVRVIIYWSRKAGNSTTISDFTTTLDPAAFTVIADRMLTPTKDKNVAYINLNLRGKVTNYNQSSSTLEYGDLRVRIIAYNPDTTARGMTWQSRLFIKNK